jgi:hypothetical protein
MSIKSSLILSSLVLMLSSQSHLILASYDASTDEEEKIAVMNSRHDMAPLFDRTNALPQMIEPFELPKIKLTDELKMTSLGEKVKDLLDQEVSTGPSGTGLVKSVIDDNLIDDTSTLNSMNKLLAQAALPFQLKLTAELRTVAMGEQVQSYLEQEPIADLASTTVDSDLYDDALTLILSKRLEFEPRNEPSLAIETNSEAVRVKEALKNESFQEKLVEQFQKLDISPYSYQAWVS